MRDSRRSAGLRGAVACLVLVIGSAACGGGGGIEDDAGAGGTADGVTGPVATEAVGSGTTEATADDPTAVLAGVHRYDVTHENLGSCTGAADDRQETLEFTFTAEGLTLANLDYDWTEDFAAVATGRYQRTQETSEGAAWRKTLTLSTEGFVMLSETNDPAQVGQGSDLQPCLRYTYRLLD